MQAKCYTPPKRKQRKGAAMEEREGGREKKKEREGESEILQAGRTKNTK